ncbi:MAG: LptF/LptG family permease, partial [Methylococcales bacterium]|nr:LptF/LptG family permease [Methylococcales bacterium]
GNYRLKEILYYVLLTSPGVFYELLPASALLGSLFVLGSMGNNRELIAMRAAGLSVFGIIKAVMLAGCVLVMIALIVGEFIAPTAQRMAHMSRVSAQNSQINVSAELHKAIHVDQAMYLGNQEWQMNKIVSSEISIEQMTSSYEETQVWKSSIAPNLLKIVAILPNNLSMYDLAGYVKFLKKNNQKSHLYEAAFWGRIVNPLVTFIMLLLATPFVIGIKRGVSAGERMMLGVLIGMGFNIIDKTVGHLGLIYDLNPPLMAFAPSIAVLLIALFYLKRVQS